MYVELTNPTPSDLKNVLAVPAVPGYVAVEATQFVPSARRIAPD